MITVKVFPAKRGLVDSSSNLCRFRWNVGYARGNAGRHAIRNDVVDFRTVTRERDRAYSLVLAEPLASGTCSDERRASQLKTQSSLSKVGISRF